VHGSSAAGPAIFTVVDAGAGSVGLKADNGKYLARCNGCIPGAPADMLTVHATTPKPIKFEKLLNGKCALKADSGKYIGRCNRCSTSSSQPDTVSITWTDPNQSNVQIEVTRIPVASQAMDAGTPAANTPSKFGIYCPDMGGSRGVLCVSGPCPAGWRSVFFDSGCQVGQKCCI